MKFSNYVNESIISEAPEAKATDFNQALLKLKPAFRTVFKGEMRVISEEKYTKTGGVVGTGVRLMNEEGYQIRINWDKKESVDLKKQQRADKKDLSFSTIDYWSPLNNNFIKPSLSVLTIGEYQLVDIFKILKKNVPVKLPDSGLEIVKGKKESNTFDEAYKNLNPIDILPAALADNDLTDYQEKLAALFYSKGLSNAVELAELF